MKSRSKPTRMIYMHVPTGNARLLVHEKTGVNYLTLNSLDEQSLFYHRRASLAFLVAIARPHHTAHSI